MMRLRLAYLGALLSMLLIAAVASAGKESPARLKVFVSILPQKYFVERVGGGLVDVKVLVGPGQSPHLYEPTPRQMAELSRSRLFFRIGVPFEQSLMPKIESTFKDLTVVDTRKGIKLRKMDPEDRHDHEAETAGHHGDEPSEHRDSEHSGKREGHRHEAGAADPHIWLDPLLVKIQAQTICDALSTIDPRHADAYRKNLGTFRQDLDRVDALITKALEPLKGKEIFVFHPAYGYFADRYGLRQAAVEVGGKEPAARQLSALIGKAKEAGVRVIFVQPQFDRKNAQTIASAIDGAVVSLDPLAPDYIRNLQEMAAKVKSALSK